MSELIIDKLTTRDGSMIGAVVVSDIDELLLLNTNKEINTTAIVKDSNRGGVFNYDATQSGVNNDGTIFDGWVRQFSGPLNVKWFGAKGDGTTDDTVAIQAAINYCQGADATGIGKAGGTLYFPFGTYKVTDTLVVDGMYSLKIYADAVLTKRGGVDETYYTLNWHGSSTKPVIQLKGGTGTPSNPNSFITIENIGINGQTLSTGNEALAGIYLGILDGENDNTLNRNVEIKNCRISFCRFGIYSGNPDALNTDHAPIVISACGIYHCGQAAIRVGTGNTIMNIDNCSAFTNGEDLSAYTADAYSSLLGANILIDSGYAMITNYTGAGDPVSADIYQANGACAIINAWSDCSGYFYYQLASTLNGGGGYQVGQITGVRHWRGDMTIGDTPNSMRIITPSTFVSSCNFYGNIVVESGNSGRPIFAGINFIRAGAGFTGSGIDTQRSLLALGTEGNGSQIIQGGVDSGSTLGHWGTKSPNQLLIGSATSGGVYQNSLRQIRGQKDTDNVVTELFDASTGTLRYLNNGYFNDTNATSITPIKADENTSFIELGARGIKISAASNFNGTDNFSTSDLEQVFETGGANENENPIFYAVADGEKGHDNGDGTVDGYTATVGSLASIGTNQIIHNPNGASNAILNTSFTYLTAGETYVAEVDIASHASANGVYLRAYNNSNDAFLNGTAVTSVTSGKIYLPFEAVANTRLEIVNRSTGGILTLNSIKLRKVNTVNSLKIDGSIDARHLVFTETPVYADDAAADAAELGQGRVYQTSTGELRIKL